MLTTPDRAGHLLRGSVLLAVAIAVNGGGGFAFWWVAAWRFDASSVGSGQELFVALTVAVCLTSMGLPIAVARFCADGSSEAHTLFRWALLYSAVTSVVGALLLMQLVPGATLEPLASLNGPLSALVLATLVTGMSLAVLVEVRLMALRRWGWVLGRVALVVGLRLPLLWVAPGPVSRWFVFLVAGAPALSGLVGAIVLLRSAPVSEARAAVSPERRRAWLRFATINYAGLLGSQAPMFLVPFVVALHVDGSAFASFYMAWAVTQTVVAIPHMMGQTYLVEADKPGVDPEHQMRLLLGLAVAVTSVIALGAVGAGRAISWSLGPEYRSVATLLPWLIAGCVPWALTSSLLAQARHRHESKVVVGVTACFCAATLGGALWLSGTGGAEGAAHGWLAANVLTAAAALAVAPPLSARGRTIDLRTEPSIDLDLEPTFAR